MNELGLHHASDSGNLGGMKVLINLGVEVKLKK